MKKISKYDIKIMTVPIIIFVLIIILTLISAKIILDNIARLNSEMAVNQKSENALQEKLTSLQSITEKISGDSQNAVLALPGTNPVLNVITNIKTQSAQNGLLINGIKSNSSASLASGDQINTTSIDFQVDGGLQGISNFISNIKNTNPIIRIDAIKIKNTSSNGEGDIFTLYSTLIAYWSNFPTTIPAITEPIVKFTPEEENVLAKISAFQKPAPIIENTSSPSGQLGRLNPFGN